MSISATEPTPAERAMENLMEGLANLPQWEQQEVREAKDAIDRLVLRYGSSAKLACMAICLQTTIDEGA